MSRGVVEQWLGSGNDGLTDMAVGNYLRIHQRNAPDSVAMLLEPYVGSGGNWPQRLEMFATWADASRSRRLFDLILQLIQDGTLDGARGPIAENSTFWNIFYGLDTERPEWVGELLSHRIRRRLAILKEDGAMPRRDQLLGYDPGAAEMFAKAAESAPLAFVQHVLPVVLEVADLTARGDAPRRDAVWNYLIRTAHPDAEQACLEALTRAMERMADVASVERCDEVLNELRRRETHVANHLLLAFYRGCPDRLGGEAVRTLCAQPWRFDCGFSDNANWCAMQTVSALAPHLSSDDLGRLEAEILHYVPRYERSFEGRKSRGWTRFALLSAIPQGLRSERGQTSYRELERKFGKPPGEPRELKAEFVGPPISPSESENMTDDQ